MRPRFRPSSEDAGFSLVEMIVAMALFGVVLGFISTSVASSQKAANVVRLNSTLGEEARGTINRISRELRQARAISAVQGSDGKNGMTFEVDFNGNGLIDTTSVDPERLTYSYDGVRIQLSAADDTGAVTTRPVLNGVVTDFAFEYRSSDYLFDCDGNGVTTWQELDIGICRPAGTTVGNANGVLDGPELKKVDSVILTFTVAEGNKRQTYRTQIDLRNAL